MIGATITLDSAANEEDQLPLFGGWFFLGGCDCPDQTRHNKAEIPKGRCALLSALDHGLIEALLLVCPALHTFERYPNS